MNGGETTPTRPIDDLPHELRRRGAVGRFPPVEERAYRGWSADQTRPLFRAAAWASLPFWLLIPIALNLWVDGRISPHVYWLSWVVSVPALVVMLAVSGRGAPTPMMNINALLVLVVAVASQFFSYTQFTRPSQTGVLSATVWFTILPAFLRMPFRQSLILTATIVGSGTTLLLHSTHTVATSAQDTWVWVILLTAVLAIIPAIALVNESEGRNRFVDLQLLAQQHAELTRQRALIRRYVPSAVASHIEAGGSDVDAPQRSRVTVFFSDVVGFTTLADRLDPEALAELINDYVGALAELIERHGGTLNEFAGDGVMALFGAPDQAAPDLQVRSALAAAQELQASLPVWSERWYRLGITEPLQTRIGINTGIVSVGTFGSSVRATYTGIGLQTNIASRIQAHAQPGTTLISGTSWAYVKDTISCTPRGEVMVKGVHFPIHIYQAPAVGTGVDPGSAQADKRGSTPGTATTRR